MNEFGLGRALADHGHLRLTKTNQTMGEQIEKTRLQKKTQYKNRLIRQHNTI